MGLIRIGIALLLCAGLGHASVIYLTGLDTSVGQQDSLWINEDGTNNAVYWAGGVNVKIDGTYDRVVWCAQLFVTINLSTNYETTVTFADTPNLQRAGWMIRSILPGVTGPTEGAALQLAIWDIIEDNGDGFDVAAGRIYQSTDAHHATNSSVLTTAQAYEAQSLGQSFAWVPVYHNVTMGGGAPAQNLIGSITQDGGPLSETAEPRDVVLILGGLAMMAVGRWRKRRAQREGR